MRQRIHFKQPTADIDAGRADADAAIKYGNVGSSAANIDVDDAGVELFGKLFRAGAFAGDDAFQIRSRRSHHEVTGDFGQRVDDFGGIFFFRRFAGDDDRAGVDIFRLNPRRGVFLFDDVPDGGAIDPLSIDKRRKMDIPHV